MLSDEERKAIDELWHFDCAYNREIKIVLNIIKKQSQEIESLKEDKEIIKRKYEANRRNYDRVYNLGKIYTNKKWEDKIKAKIEEIKNTHNGDDFNLTNVIMIMQSLLEKE